jgi:hypothetical protein
MQLDIKYTNVLVFTSFFVLELAYSVKKNQFWLLSGIQIN